MAAAEAAGVRVDALRARLEEAARWMDAKQVERASEAAQAVARTAESLRAAWERLRPAMKALEGIEGRLNVLGLKDEAFRRQAAAARAREGETVEQHGMAVPAYDDTAKLAEEAAARGRTVLTLFEEASRAIAHAEAVVTEGGASAVDPDVMSLQLLRRSHELLHSAKAALRASDFRSAIQRAQQAQTVARDVRDRIAAALRTFEDVDRLLADLRREGTVAAEAEIVARSLRDAVRRGRLDSVEELASRTRDAAAKARELRREALRMVSRAEGEVNEAKAWGFQAGPLEVGLEEARILIAQGDYVSAMTTADEVRERARRMRDVHRELTNRAKALRERVSELRRVDPSNGKDVEEILKRAEDRIAEGRYEEAVEDLRVAELLGGRAHSPGPQGS